MNAENCLIVHAGAFAAMPFQGGPLDGTYGILASFSGCELDTNTETVYSLLLDRKGLQEFVKFANTILNRMPEQTDISWAEKAAE